MKGYIRNVNFIIDLNLRTDEKFFLGAFATIVIAVATMINVDFNKINDNRTELLSNDMDAMAFCEVTSRKGKVKLRCSGSGTCSTTYMGYNLTCSGKKE